MPQPERFRADDAQPTLAGTAAVRNPGESSSSDAGAPSDAPTIVDLGKDSDSPGSDRRAATFRKTPAGALDGTPILQPQSVLGQRYEILELLGQGGMGAVYKARDREVDQLVALKVIHFPVSGLVNGAHAALPEDRKSTRLNSSHVAISYAVFCLK